jgi:hypothetical protein
MGQGHDVSKGRIIPLEWYGFWSPFDKGLNHSIAFADLVLEALARKDDPLNKGVEDKVTAFRATFQASLRVRAERRRYLLILPQEQWLTDSDVGAIASAIGLDMCIWKSTGGGRASIMTPPCAKWW